MKDNFLFITLLFLIGCSDPEPCPDLEFLAEEKTTLLEGNPYTGRCMVYRDERKRSIQQYLNGKDFGKWVFYFPDGSIETKGSFKDGRRTGTWKYFYENGNIKQISKYSKTGERKGKWKVYDSLGLLIQSTKY